MAKAEVCKTFIRRFESARRLHASPSFLRESCWHPDRADVSTVVCYTLSRDMHEIVDDQRDAPLSLAAMADTGHRLRACSGAPPAFEDQAPPRPIFGEQVPLITLMLWYARDLSLTPEQVRGLEALRSDFQRTADLQTAEIQRLELELQRVLSREQIDLTQAETRIRRIESLRTELRLGRIRTVEKGKATLTPEQWRKLQPLIRGGP